MFPFRAVVSSSGLMDKRTAWRVHVRWGDRSPASKAREGKCWHRKRECPECSHAGSNVESCANMWQGAVVE
eukprot:6227430-Amphidinium_carterae.1